MAILHKHISIKCNINYINLPLNKIAYWLQYNTLHNHSSKLLDYNGLEDEHGVDVDTYLNSA